MAKRILDVFPPLPTTRYPLANGAVARPFNLGPLPDNVTNGKVQLSPYAQFSTTDNFKRLGLKPVKPYQGPTGGVPRTPDE